MAKLVPKVSSLLLVHRRLKPVTGEAGLAGWQETGLDVQGSGGLFLDGSWNGAGLAVSFDDVTDDS